ncbi:MAG: SulP family inorganic anion transporter [Bryobacteraceae bacterium]
MNPKIDHSGRLEQKRPGLFRKMLPFGGAHGMREVLAGIELAAMSIPQALGYASIAGMPAVSGLYTLSLPLLAFAIFGSSSYLVVAADSATAAILAGGISNMAPVASPRYVALAGLVALLTASLLLLARLLRLGFLADFLSRTVLVGFLTGVGFQVGSAVLGEMLGMEVHSHRTLGQLAEIVPKLSQIHLPSLALSLLVVGGVFAIEHFSPRVPGSLIAVVGGIAASAAWDFAGHGISTIGSVAGGLPYPQFPRVGWKDFEPLFPLAGSCFVMIVAQSAATARIYALRHHQRLDENSDLVGLSVANAIAGLSGTFVVNGSPTQTAMSERAGGHSQMAHIATAIAVSLVLLFLTAPFQYLPRSVLGAIVFIVAIRLIDVRGLRKIRQESPGEFALAVTTAVVVVSIGVEQGILLAMVLSLLRVVRHSYRPHTAVLVQTQNGLWQLTPVVQGAVTEPGLVVYRFGAALFYANVGMFSDQIRTLTGPDPPSLRWLVIDAGAITNVDYTAAHVMRELQQDLANRGIELVLAHVQSDLKPDLDRHYLTQALGADRIFDSLHEAMGAFHQLTSRA